MERAQLRDIVVVLPGITGSVLQRDGKDVWAPSISAGLGWALSGGASLQDLKLPDDGGIVAGSLIEQTQIIPGLVKIDGYSGLFEMIRSQFDVVSATTADPPAGNLHAFPYDWRQDNRGSAALLESFVGERLSRWREATNEPDAKVILLAHSMGGLVSRYWLECLGGWSDCRALVTFGTPHRGSLNALDFLANGYKKRFIDLTDAMRSFPSVYQLLPIYEALAVDDAFHRVGELTGVPGVDTTMAKDALAFHREIGDAVESNQKDEKYRKTGYAQIPIVGTRQPTKQSAELIDGKVTVSTKLPPVVEPLLEGGDGTVPRVAAIPVELSDDHRETFRPERHSSLQINKAILADLADRIRGVQAQGLSRVRAVEPERDERTTAPAISAAIDDVYVAGAVEIEATLEGVGAVKEPLEARIEPVDPGEPTTLKLTGTGDTRRLEAELPPGLYRVEIAMRGGGNFAPPPVHDVFQVTGPEA